MKMKPASHAFLAGLLAVTVFVLSSSSVLAQATTQINGTFAPSGKYSVNGNLSLMPLTTMQCNVAPQQTDKVEVSGVAMLDGRLLVTMTGRFTRNGQARYTLLEARGGLMGSKFSLVSIKWAMDQGLSARITYDPNHVYLEIAFERGGFWPPLDTKQPHEITTTPAPVSEARRADKPSNTAGSVFRQTVAGLTFAQRVAYQRAIEEVRWRHRIWPKENPNPKPPLDAVISQHQVEQKVEDYLRKSQLVANERGWPITVSELQAEMDRMAKHTKQPEVLRELFAALGNDPFVIAECLTKPVLVGRSVSELNVHDESFQRSVDLARVAVAPMIRAAGSVSNVTYSLPQIEGECSDDSWTPTSTAGVPDVRFQHTAVWTGSEMIIWGGLNFSPPYRLNTGGRYNPATDSWTATSLVDAPVPRTLHTGVWTGNEMIVWGGEGNGNPREVNTGGRYNPITDSWVATSTANAPLPREQHSAVWTGSEMIVWGGFNDPNVRLNTGGRYDPNTDSWTATSTINAPEARWYHRAIWTGSEMVVWGGTNETIYLNTGGRYNPDTDSWTTTSVPNNVLGRIGHTALWTGGEMMVWGGVDSTFNDCNTGARYNPTGDGWMPISTINAPSARDSHTAVWTGTEMVVWGGEFGPPGVSLDTGARYSPGTDSWLATSMVSAPHARDSHTAVWTGSEMIVWGGAYWVGGSRVFLNTGGRYCAQPGATPTATPTATPRATATATPTSTPTATLTPTTTPPSPTPTATATLTPTPSSTPRPSPTPRIAPTPRSRPTPPPRP